MFGAAPRFRLRKISQAGKFTLEMPVSTPTPSPAPDVGGVLSPSPSPSPWALAGLGVQFAVALVASVTAGSWLDARWHTAPVCLLAGVVLGGGGTFYISYRRLMKASMAPPPSAPIDGARPK